MKNIFNIYFNTNNTNEEGQSNYQAFDNLEDEIIKIDKELEKSNDFFFKKFNKSPSKSTPSKFKGLICTPSTDGSSFRPTEELGFHS